MFDKMALCIEKKKKSSRGPNPQHALISTLGDWTHCDWMAGHKAGSFHWLAVVGHPELDRRGLVAAEQFLWRQTTQF